MIPQKTEPEHRTLGQRILARMHIRPVRLVLWLVAITIVSFAIGFGILAAGGGYPPPGGDDFSLFRSNAFHAPSVNSVALGGADAGSAKITLGAGRLTLAGGAPRESFMEATVFSKAPEWQPELSTARNGSAIHTSMTEKGHTAKEWFAVDSPNRWNIRMNDQVPLDLEIDVGAGDSRLNLGTLNLSALTVNAGAGDTKIDLSGYRGSRFDADLSNGLGDLTIRVPKNSNMRIVLVSGVGDIEDNGFTRDNESLTTPGFDPSRPVTTIRVKHGVGSVSLEAV